MQVYNLVAEINGRFFSDNGRTVDRYGRRLCSAVAAILYVTQSCKRRKKNPVPYDMMIAEPLAISVH